MDRCVAVLGLPGRNLAHFGGPWGCPGASWSLLECSEGPLGTLGAHLGALGVLLVASWDLLGASCAPLGCLLGRLGGFVGTSWGPLGAALGSS